MLPYGGTYAYTIAYPDGEVFYVGKGTGDRMYSHLYASRANKAQQERYQVIRNIWAQGGQPLVTIFFVKDELIALRIEQQLIRFYGGYAKLTNQPSGGDLKRRAKQLNEERKKESESHHAA